MLSGLYMTSIDIDIIHGDHLVTPHQEMIDFKRVNSVPAQYKNLENVRLTSHNDVPVYLVTSSTQSLAINAASGQQITIDSSYIERHAQHIYSQSGTIVSTILLPQYPRELGGRPQPIWQVVFNDDLSPTLYFSADNGQFIKARSDLWRIFDVMWMLHIMDYQESEDVNNLLLSVAVVTALLLASIGVWLIFYSFNQRQQASASHRLIRTIHKWLALIVGIQMLLWLTSGLAFNLLSSDKVNLKHQLLTQPHQPFQPADIDIVALSQQFPLALSINIYSTPMGAMVNVEQRNDQAIVSLASLKTSQITETQARLMAEQSYWSSAAINDVEIIVAGHQESRKFNRDLWRISYQDNENTALYVDAKTGQALAITDDNWRLKDWFWMLHIMDYSQRTDFNTPLLITAASLASLMALSGMLMLFYVFSRHDFGFSTKVRQYQISIFSGSRQQTHQVTGNQPLLHALKEQQVELPSGCGGGGTCCQCMIIAPHVSQPLTSQERTSLSMAELNQGRRLACQLQVNGDISIELPEQVATQQRINAKVLSSEFKTPFIKEIILRLPPGHGFTFSAGQYVNVDIPAFQAFIGPQLAPAAYHQQWQEHRIVNQRVRLDSPVNRSYSIASRSDDINTIVFNIKLALPESGHGLGIASSYMCSLSAGASVSFSGPFGEFLTEFNSPKELILIGAGAGMAPLKSHIDSLLSQHSRRTISLWFGARTQDDIFYQTHFDGLSRRHANFSWHVSLSKPTGTDWAGNRGHIQHALIEQKLTAHRQLAQLEFLVCGPQKMMRDIRLRLQRLGVAPSAIKYDDFS